MTDTRPWENQFTVERIDVVEETPTLRVLEMTLEPGEKVPWHWHTAITDRFYCLAGTVDVESRAPAALHRLTAGDTCAIPEKTAHEVRNVGGDTARLVLIQGVGAYDYHPVGHETESP